MTITVSELHRNTEVFENMKAICMCDVLDSKAIFARAGGDT